MIKVKDSLKTMNIDKVTARERNTMLHIAIKFNKEKVVKLLLKLGADPYQPNKAGLTSFDLSVKTQDKNKR